MGEGQVHPAIVVEIERGDTETRPRLGEKNRTEFPFSWILEHNWRVVRCLGQIAASAHHDVDGTIIIEVGANCCRALIQAVEPRGFCHLSECAVSIVAPHHAATREFLFRRILGRFGSRASDV